MITLIIILTAILLSSNACLGDTLRPYLEFEKKAGSTDDVATNMQVLPEIIRLKNLLTGEDFELSLVGSKKKGSEGEYMLWLGGVLIEDSNFIFYESERRILVRNIFVGKQSYKHTSKGIGLTILRYLAAYAKAKGKELRIGQTNNYGLMRLCYRYISPKAKYRIGNKYKYFGDVDWLRQYGPVVINIGGIGKNVLWGGRFSMGRRGNEMKYVKGSCYPEKMAFIADDIRVTNKQGEVEVAWKESSKKEEFQVRLAKYLDHISIAADDLLINVVDPILTSRSVRAVSRKAGPSL